MKTNYDLIVIGGGSAGLTAAGLGASVGAKTLMVEKDKPGGDCTWHGCIPSKTLIDQARKVHESGAEVDFSEIKKRLDRVRQQIYEDADHPDKFREMGVVVKKGEATFTGSHTVSIWEPDGSTEQVSGRYFIIATGSRPHMPAIEGLGDTPCLTSQTIFEIDDLPESMVILGAGPVGIEMAQAFQRLGTVVTVVESGDRILKQDEPELTAMLADSLKREGVSILLNSRITRTESEAGHVKLTLEEEEGADRKRTKVLYAEKLFIATGRLPNIERLGTEAAGIEVTKKGISVNDRCRTSRRHIYAVGDVTGRYQFTHMSEHMAKVAVTNALLKVPMKTDTRHVPWCTFTSPGMAHLGQSRQELEAERISYQTYRFPYNKIDRALTEGMEEGWIHVYARKWNGKILGVDVLGANAGEVISHYALAMKNGISLRRMSDTIHPYPTYALGARRAADQWYVQKQSVGVVRWIRRIFRFRGPLPDEADSERIL